MSNSTHRVNVVRIEEILPHPNADTLGIVYIGGYQCVVKKDAYKVGDLAIYVQPDTIVPAVKQFAFLWDDREFPGGVPERKRRVTVRKFRKEWSEGLLMPILEFLDPYNPKIHPLDWAEGDDVAELLGFTHYEEPEPAQNTQQHGKQYKGWPKSLRGWFYFILAKLYIYRPAVYGADCTKAPKQFAPIYDVEGFKNYPRTFAEGEEVVVTEKIHGSNARYMFDGEKMHVGSKNLWKSEKSTCIWRRALRELPWIEEMCRAYPNITFYGEVTPTQKGYAYGCAEREVRLFIFDMLLPDGRWEDKQWFTRWTTEPSRVVPVLYSGPYDEAKIKALVEGPSAVPGAKHIREGIVISSAVERTVRGLGRAQLKLKSMKFLEKDGKE